MAVPRSRFARTFYRCADRRRVEVGILLDAGQPTGAVYLAGYVVEFMLKALILETTPVDRQAEVLNELRRAGHDLVRLLEVYQVRGGARPPQDVRKAFALLGDWGVEIRYDPKEIDPAEAETFLTAVDKIQTWLDGRI